MKRQLVVWIMLVTLGLTACSGGGEGNTATPPGSGGTATTTPTSTIGTILSGTAAAGAPIVGTVTVKDSSQPPKDKFVTIAADGKYSVDVSDLTPPFMLRADGTLGGRTYSLYSAAASADVGGTVNITPLTDLIVANIAGQVAANFYQSGNFSAFTPDALNAAEAALQSRLQPILTEIGLADTIDLLRASFSADHTGVDAALDILRVTVDPVTAQATIKNVITNQQLIDDLASQSDTTVMTDTTGVAMGRTDFQQIVAQFDAWTNLFATSLPASNNAALNALFDGPTFLWDGIGLAAFVSKITTFPELVGAKFTVVSLDSLTPASAPTSAQVRWNLITREGKVLRTGAPELKLNKVNGVWLIAGNQHIAGGEVISVALHDHDGAITTGLTADGFRDEGGRGIDYAIVTGKGLPTTTGGANGRSTGLLLVNYTSDNSFGIAQVGAVYDGISTPKISTHNDFVLADAIISTIADNEVYTHEFWEDNNTPNNLADDVKLATYTNVLGKRPYLNSELSAASFPVITTTPAAIQSAATAGGNLTVTWILPTGLQPEMVDFYRGYSDGSSDSVEADIVGTATSSTLTIAAPTRTVRFSHIGIRAVDVFGRELRFSLNGQ